MLLSWSTIAILYYQCRKLKTQTPHITGESGERGETVSVAISLLASILRQRLSYKRIFLYVHVYPYFYLKININICIYILFDGG